MNQLSQNHPSKHHKNNRIDRVATLLSTCKSLPQLKQINAYIFRSLLHQNNSLASTLVTLYTSFSFPHYTHYVFSTITNPTLCLFNHTIKAFSKTPSFCIYSLHLYVQMTRNCVKPDNYTYPFVINSCATLGGLEHGVEVHGRAMRTGFTSYLPVLNALVDMYGKCELLGCAHKVFDEMLVRDVVSYNALLGAHARVGKDMAGAQSVFDEMPVRNVISWNGMIVGYVNAGELNLARGVFDRMPQRNVVSWTTILVGYTKNGYMDLAEGIFSSMPERNLISWTAMITGYAQNGHPKEALCLFRKMETIGIKPDAVTMTSVMSAIGQLGESDLAHSIGSYVKRERIQRNAKVLTALLDMHAKCGNIVEACQTFEEIPDPDVYPYSALITGLASHGHGLKALDLFKRMQEAGVEPDYVTFVGVLTACTHTGLVEDGLRFWESMTKEYKIEPDADHYGCLVDMLGRAGKLNEAYKMVKSMPMGPRAGALGAVLAACKTYDNMEIAESVCKELIILEPENTGNYVLLSNIYASRERWDEATQVRMAMKDRKINKLHGCSWV
ncbi:hypothetical protein ACHQM5_010932 [Ranunculus cassubicifolius]